MKRTRVILTGLAILASFSLNLTTAWADDGPISLNVVKLKNKGSWTEVMLAIANNGNKDLEFQCCTVYLENTDGYAVSSLNRGEVESQIHNKARTGALIGAIVGAGLGIGGAISGNEDLGWAALGVGGTSAIAGLAGSAGAEGAQRALIIDDIMRNQVFPSGLKVAGIVYFPPKKKWPGSQKAQAVHLTYTIGNHTYHASAPVTN